MRSRNLESVLYDLYQKHPEVLEWVPVIREAAACPTKTEWAIKSSLRYFACRDEQHARGMIRSTSPVIGPMEGRKIVRREVTEWIEA
jgi:hypothetical protein